ncbi:MAG: T9SS type A sorting domain-containing protein, partial [Ignavibacteria bacterium]|nr:T9SS type A sorting domain-containing protein [Ignavibacteria bacterium]
GDIGRADYFEAFTQKRLLRPVAGLESDSVWTYIGPNNFGGRMISVALNPLNPSTIYAGAAAGGLWRSFSGGIAGDWERITTGFPVLGVNAIAIDPVDTGTVYIGTGELYRYQISNGGIMIRTTRGSVGMGILKTTDAGVTWTHSLDWSYNDRSGVPAICINPLNRSTVIAATSEGVYRSTDAGGSWEMTLDAIMARDLLIHPNDTTLVLATCGNFASAGHGIYRSTDGGMSFVQLGGFPSFSGMAVLGQYRSDPDTVYLSISDSTTTVGTFYISTDFGESWTLTNTDNRSDVQGFYARFVAVHPTIPTRIVRGAQQLYLSTNSGSSFSQIEGGWADYHSFALHPDDPDVLYIAHDGGIWRSDDFGGNFYFVGEGIEAAQFYNGFSSSASDPLRAHGQVQDHFGWMYTGSENWVNGAVDEVGWTAINQGNDFIMYAGNRGGGSMYKSTNRGNSFQWSSTGLNGGVSSWNTPFVLSTSNPNVLYFGRSIIFKSTNASATWSATNGGSSLDGNPAISMAMSFSGTDTVYVGTAPLVDRTHIFRTTDGGASWTDITGILPDRYPLDLAVDPSDPSVVYVAYGGFDSSHVFKTTDAGGVWTDMTGSLPDVPATALVVDPANPEVVYVGTDIGVFVSTVGGSDWMTWDAGLPEAVLISDLSLATGPRIIRAVTHSNGVYERDMLDIQTSVTGTIETPPVRFSLRQNYPNPFNPSTEISFSVAERGPVRITVFDLNGREVTTILDESLEPGQYTRSFDGRNLSSGVYYYQLRADRFFETRRMMLIR